MKVKNKGLCQVRASAGSGKTFRLTSDFIDILGGCEKKKNGAAFACVADRPSGVFSIDEILAITFTNAAACEMRSRVITRLKTAALGIDGNGNSESAEAWLQILMRDMGLLNIRTIDSLLHLIVRASSLELGLNPDFEVTFELEDVFDIWLEQMLETARDDPEIRSEFADAFKTGIELGNFKGFLSGKYFHKHLYRILRQILLGKFESVSSVSQLEDKENQLQTIFLQRAQNLLDSIENSGVKVHKTALSVIESVSKGAIPDNMSRYMEKSSVEEILAGKSMPTPELEDAYDKCKIACKRYYDLVPALCMGRKLLAFEKIALRLADRFRKERRIARNLPSILIPSLAAYILNDGMGVSDAICRLGTRLAHFLVDEFQDTSLEQWQVLKTLAREALSTGGSLTWVGDVKQSIYGWRGGDPDLFDAAGNDPELLSISELHTDSLKMNRRSLGNIVAHNNNLFSVLGNYDNAEIFLEKMLGDAFPEELKKEYAIKLTAAFKDVNQEILPENIDSGTVESIVIEGDKSEDIQQKSLMFLVDLLGKRLKQKYAWGDILILCRSNAACLQIATELINRQIPVVTENSLLLSGHFLVSQLVAFLRFVSDPEDDIAFWTIITGSILQTHPLWQDAPLPVLADWACLLSEKPLSKAFARDYPQLWKLFFEPFLFPGKLLSPYDMTRELLVYLDIEKRFSADATFLRRFLEILHKAEHKGICSVPAFLEYWQKEGQEEKAPMPETADAVSIMTIHKAKGLEKKVVIVPKTDFSIRASGEIEINSVDGLQIPVAITGKAAGELYYRDIGKQALEALNVLYVAFTRAKEELYYFRSKKKNKVSSMERALNFLIEQSKIQIPEIAIPDQEIIRQEDTRITISDNDVLSLPETGWQPMQWLPRLKIYRAHLANISLTPAERGTFVHSCLEKLNFSVRPDIAAENAFRAALRETSFNIPGEAHEELLESIKWFANLPQARNWLEHGFREQTLVDGNGAVLRPDLLVYEADRLLVIDYKTGCPESRHISQVENYLQCLGEGTAFTGKAEGLVIYLDQKKFQHVKDGDCPPLSSECPV